jgi:hypothetical protein
MIGPCARRVQNRYADPSRVTAWTNGRHLPNGLSLRVQSSNHLSKPIRHYPTDRLLPTIGCGHVSLKI